MDPRTDPTLLIYTSETVTAMRNTILARSALPSTIWLTLMGLPQRISLSDGIMIMTEFLDVRRPSYTPRWMTRACPSLWWQRAFGFDFILPLLVVSMTPRNSPIDQVVTRFDSIRRSSTSPRGIYTERNAPFLSMAAFACGATSFISSDESDLLCRGFHLFHVPPAWSDTLRVVIDSIRYIHYTHSMPSYIASRGHT